jgi:hypothetical protein
MDQVKSLVDFYFNVILNFYNTFRDYGGIYFTIWFAIVIVIPLFKRIIKNLKS